MGEFILRSFQGFMFDLRFGAFAIPVPWLLAYCFSINLLSFVLTYLLGLAVLGAGVALAVCFIDSFLRTVLSIIQHTPFYFEFAKNIPLPWIWSLLTFLLSVLLWLLCIVVGARSLERGGGIKPGNGILLGCLLVIGPLLTACVLRWNISQVEMYSQEPFWPIFWQYAANTLF